MKRCTPKYSESELLDILKNEAHRLGRTPTGADFDSDKTLPSSKTYCARFGRWLKALELAGLEYSADRPIDALELQKQKVRAVNLIRSVHLEKGRVPVFADINPVLSSSTIGRLFGSWNNALVDAGFKPRCHRKEYLYHTDEELLTFLRDWHAINGHSPKISDFYSNPAYPSPSTYKKRFGGWGLALQKAGLTARSGPAQYTICALYATCFIRRGDLNFLQRIVLSIAHGLLNWVRSS